MGFIKNFRRDFAQAVNELLPDGEEKAGKKKKESRQNAEDAELLRPVADVKPQEPVRDANVQDAVSEALLREEAEQLRDEIRQNTEQRVMEMNRELDEEIDSLPDVDASESEEDDATETDETFDIGSGYEAESEYEEDPEDDLEEDPEDDPEEDSEDDLEDDSEDDPEEETDIESDELSEEAYEAKLLSKEAISEYEAEEVYEPETLYDLDAAEVTGDKDIAFPESAEEDPTASGMSDGLTSDEYTEAKMPEDPEAESAGAGEPSEGFDSEPKEEAEGFDSGPKEEAEELRKESEVSRLAELEAQAGLNDAISGLAADCTYITAKTKITGDIETEGDIDLIGTVYGNIDCAGKLIVGGTISGEVKAKELYANQAKIEGPVSVTDDVKIGVGSVIIGKITGSSAVIAGAVNGDIDIQGPVIVDSTAVIVGNIKSRSVQINSGAIIEGFCSQAYLDVDVKKYFSMEEAHTASEEMKIEELMPEASEITGEDAKDIKEDVTEKLSRDEKTHSGNGSNRNKNKNRNHSGKNQE